MAEAALPVFCSQQNSHHPRTFERVYIGPFRSFHLLVCLDPTVLFRFPWLCCLFSCEEVDYRTSNAVLPSQGDLAIIILWNFIWISGLFSYFWSKLHWGFEGITLIFLWIPLVRPDIGAKLKLLIYKHEGFYLFTNIPLEIFRRVCSFPYSNTLSAWLNLFLSIF